MAKYVVTVFNVNNTVRHECIPADSFADAIRWIHANVGQSKDRYHDICFELRTNGGEITQASYQPRRDDRAVETVKWIGEKPSCILIQSAETAREDLAERLSEHNDVASQRTALRAAGVID